MRGSKVFVGDDMKEVLLTLGRQAPHVLAVIVVVVLFLRHIETAGEWQNRTMQAIGTQFERLNAEFVSHNRIATGAVGQIDQQSRSMEKLAVAIDRIIERMASWEPKR